MPNPKLRKEDIPRCVKMKEHGCNDKDVAAMLGVRPQTFSTWINHPKNKTERELSEALKEASTKAKDVMLTCIIRAAVEDRQWTAAAWWLERMFPEEWSKPEIQLALAQEREDGEPDALSKALMEIAEKL